MEGLASITWKSKKTIIVEKHSFNCSKLNAFS